MRSNTRIHRLPHLPEIPLKTDTYPALVITPSATRRVSKIPDVRTDQPCDVGTSILDIEAGS